MNGSPEIGNGLGSSSLGRRPWSVVSVVLSTLGSAVALSAAGAFCALLYPILKELRVGTVRGVDGTEVRILLFQTNMNGSPELGNGLGSSSSLGRRPWSVVSVVLSTLGAAVALSAAGAFCALLYPILKELRVGTVRGVDGTEVRILGFWSILVMSLLVGCICCVFSLTITYLDSYQPGVDPPMPLTLSHLRLIQGQSFHVGYSVAVLNGFMAALTVIWSLS